MPMNKAILAAYRAATRIRPDIKEFYKAQRAAEDLSAKLAIPNPRCRVDDAFAVMPDGYRVPLRIFTPLDIDFSLASGFKVSEDWRGTILFFHGGGWVNGDVDFYADACSTMALKLERRVVSVDYRRAPEHRFPQASEDCYEVTRQLFAGKLLPDVDPRRIVLLGDSAGGNLAAVVSLPWRATAARFRPPTQVLLYLVTYDDHDPRTSWFDPVRENGEDYLLTWRDIRGYMELYVFVADRLRQPLLRAAARSRPSGPAAHPGGHSRVLPAARRGRGIRGALGAGGRQRAVLPRARRRARVPAVSFGGRRGQRHLPDHRALP